MRKPAFCICENKASPDQHLCFRYTVRKIPLLSKFEGSGHKPSVAVQPGFCQTWSEIPKDMFFHDIAFMAFSSPEPKAHKVSL